ncbi:MAG: hypothetical protein EXR62_12945 [Chloroflexi bacterium]|nr:hypothetical protein [Chloroflexota bacterium]
MSLVNDWFTGFPGKNLYDISESLRRGFWSCGYSATWMQAQSTELPYRATGRWRNQDVALEWEPNRFAKLTMQSEDKAVVDGLSFMVQMKPVLQYVDAKGQIVYEWWPGRPTGRLKTLAESGIQNPKQLR